MNKLLAFGASSSKNSRNKKLASYVANRMAPKEAILVDLNEFEMPIYSEDREQEIGIPDKAYEFKKLVNESIGIIISLAEHNGSYTSAFKNIYDWISVIETNVWGSKPLIFYQLVMDKMLAKQCFKQPYLAFLDKVNRKFLIFHFQTLMKTFLMLMELSTKN